MTQIILNVEDDKLNAFMEMIKNLNYVSVFYEDGIPDWQKTEVEYRLKEIESGEMEVRPWKDAKNDIFKK
jgi:hypothetical protein